MKEERLLIILGVSLVVILLFCHDTIEGQKQLDQKHLDQKQLDQKHQKIKWRWMK